MILVLYYIMLMLAGPIQIGDQVSAFDSLIRLSETQTEAYQLDEALLTLVQAEDLITPDNRSAQTAKILFYRAYAFDFNGSLDTALLYYDQSETLYREIGAVDDVADCLNYKAGACFFAGDYDQALAYYLVCLDYTDEHDLKDTRLKALNNLGVVYRVTDKYEQALQIYQETLQLSKEVQDSNMVGASYHNIGVAHSFDDSQDEALLYLDSALQQYTLLRDTMEMGRTSNAIGDSYYMEGSDLLSAKQYLLQGERFLSKYNQQEILSNTYLTLGNIEQDLKNYPQSKLYYDKGMGLIKDTDRSDQLKDFYKAYESLLFKMGDYRQSRDYLSKYVELNEELSSSEKTEAIAELQTKYETQQKENQIQLLNSQNEIQNTKLTARQNQLKVVGIGLLLLIGLLGLVYRLNNQLKAKNKTITQALSDKDTLIREVHHRVKNNLQMVSGLLNLQSDYVTDDAAVKALKDSEVRVQSIALLHQDLYSNMSLRDVNSHDYLNKLLDNLRETYQADDRGIAFDADIQAITIDVENMIPIGLIVNELVTNSLKHAFVDQGQGLLNISLHEMNNKLILSVKDNGTSYTDQSEEGSFGSLLVQNFALRLDADVQINKIDGYEVIIEMKNYKKSSTHQL